MKYYIDKASFSFVYSLVSSLTAVLILCIEDMIWLKAILLALNLGLYVYVIAAVGYQDGQNALKTRNANDLEREIIIKTGEDRPLNVPGEFKPWKGFVIGAISCIPLFITMLIHTFVIIGDPTNTSVGGIAGFFYMVILGFFRMDIVSSGTMGSIIEDGQNIALSAGTFYWTLLAVPIVILSVGIGYYLGGKKIERQQQRIKEHQRLMRGE